MYCFKKWFILFIVYIPLLCTSQPALAMRGDGSEVPEPPKGGLCDCLCWWRKTAQPPAGYTPLDTEASQPVTNPTPPSYVPPPLTHAAPGSLIAEDGTGVTGHPREPGAIDDTSAPPLTSPAPIRPSAASGATTNPGDHEAMHDAALIDTRAALRLTPSPPRLPPPPASATLSVEPGDRPAPPLSPPGPATRLVVERGATITAEGGTEAPPPLHDTRRILFASSPLHTSERAHLRETRVVHAASRSGVALPTPDGIDGAPPPPLSPVVSALGPAEALVRDEGESAVTMASAAKRHARLDGVDALAETLAGRATEVEEEEKIDCLICWKSKGRVEFTRACTAAVPFRFCNMCYDSCTGLEQAIERHDHPAATSPGFNVLVRAGSDTFMYSPRSVVRQRRTPVTPVRSRPTAAARPSISEPFRVEVLKSAHSHLLRDTRGSMWHLNRFVDNFEIHMVSMVAHFLPKLIDISSKETPPQAVDGLYKYCRDSFVVESSTSSALQLYLGGYQLLDLIGRPQSYRGFAESTNHYVFAQGKVIGALMDIILTRIRFITQHLRRLDSRVIEIFNSPQAPTTPRDRFFQKEFLASTDKDFDRCCTMIFDENELGWPGFRPEHREMAEWYWGQMPLTHNLYGFTDPATGNIVGYAVGILERTREAYCIPDLSGPVAAPIGLAAASAGITTPPPGRDRGLL
jgi:hypothetical protein